MGIQHTCVWVAGEDCTATDWFLSSLFCSEVEDRLSAVGVVEDSSATEEVDFSEDTLAVLAGEGFCFTDGEMLPKSIFHDLLSFSANSLVTRCTVVWMSSVIRRPPIGLPPALPLGIKVPVGEPSAKICFDLREKQKEDGLC